MRILYRLVLLTGLLIQSCTEVIWTAPDGSKIVANSFLSNKKLSGSLEIDGPRRKLVINEFEEDQTTGAAAVTEAAVKAAITAVKH